MTHSPEFPPTQEQIRLGILQEKFCGIFGEDKKTQAVEVFKKIAEHYQSKDRAYHNFEHIEKLLSFLERHSGKITDRMDVKLVAYFHDVIYDTTKKDNEEQSAEYAQNYLRQLGISAGVINHVVALIRATAKHKAIEDDADSAIFLDGDLAILGSSEEEYDKYSAKIRKEYAWVPDEQYKLGRRQILESFLKRPKIYFTKSAGEELEDQARKNITREIAGLG